MASTTPITNTSFFRPTSITGCALWLDAADSATVLGSGANVSNWNDKSGNIRNLTTVLSGSGTIRYSNVSLVFNNTAYMFINTPVNLQNFTVFFIGNSLVTSGSANNQMIFCARPTSGNSYNSADGLGLYYDYTATKQTRFYGTSLSAIQDAVTFVNPVLNCYTQNAAGSLSSFLYGSNTATVATTARTTTTQGFAVGAEFVGGAYATIGANNFQMNEVIVYNTVLSTTQRQQVEGHLAWKWGLQRSLPVNHPYYNNPQQSIYPYTLLRTIPQPQNTSFWRAFSPTGIPNCVGWFDGKDPLGTGVVPAAGAAVSTWVDKSGQANNAITVGSNPTYSSNGFVIFNGSNTLRFTNPNALVASNTFSIFVVEQRSNPPSPSNFTYWLGGTATSANTNLQFGYRLPNQVTLGFFANDYNLTVASPTSNEPFRQWGGIWDGTSKSISLNGTVGSSAATGNLTSWVGGSIGYYAPTSNFYIGNIAEIIFFKPALNATNRQQVEGYLAYKWGLQSNLPTTHPVASNQSAILFSNIVIPLSKTIVMSGTNRWQPSAVSGLALWLDAADSSAIQFSSGANISNWRDKSGNGRNATQGTVINQPSIGNRSVVFDTNKQLTTTYTSFPASETIFIVLNVFSATNGLEGQLLQTSGVGGRQFSLNGFRLVTAKSGVGYLIGLGAGGTLSSNIPTLVGSTNDGSQIFHYINGSVTGTNLSITPYSGTGTTFIGNTSGLNTGLVGYFNEILIYSNTLTIPQRQITEGYLAWKWGLRASLPANHPYKIIPPS
jgi:hypothetical protein